jgi:hypothetical protein
MLPCIAGRLPGGALGFLGEGYFGLTGRLNLCGVASTENIL